MTKTDTGVLNSLLRGEISATETFNQALEKFAGRPEEADLRRMRDEHREAANALRVHVHQHGAEPDTDSGWWGTWAKFVEGAAKVFGHTAALKALKEGAERGVKDYQKAMDDKDVAADCKELIRSRLLPQCQANVATLDRLMSAK